MIIRKQAGIGLVEVLVALVLLAVGVLGFTALQLKAVDSTSEALTRSQATLILRGITESIRANASGQASYPAAVKSFVGAGDKTVKDNCFNKTCTPAQMASYDAYLAADAASKLGISITMVNCPGVGSAINRQCLFAAWDETASQLTADDYSACMKSNGVYEFSAKCLMMEAY